MRTHDALDQLLPQMLLPSAGVSTPATVDWTAIGSIATAIAVILASIVFLRDIKRDRDQLTRERAAQIRLDLRAVIAESERLAMMLRDGSPLISGASHIAKEFSSRLDGNLTVEELRQAIENDPMLLSAAVDGWSSSPQTTRLEDRLSKLEDVSLSTRGQLRVLFYATKTAVSIIKSVYSPESYFEIMSTETNRRAFVQYLENQPSSEFTNIFTSFLQVVAASKYTCLCSSAADALLSFARLLAETFADLGDEQLVAISDFEQADMSEINWSAKSKEIARSLETMGAARSATLLKSAIQAIGLQLSEERRAQNAADFTARMATIVSTVHAPGSTDESSFATAVLLPDSVAAETDSTGNISSARE